MFHEQKTTSLKDFQVCPKVASTNLQIDIPEQPHPRGHCHIAVDTDDVIDSPGYFPLHYYRGALLFHVHALFYPGYDFKQGQSPIESFDISQELKPFLT